HQGIDQYPHLVGPWDQGQWRSRQQRLLLTDVSEPVESPCVSMTQSPEMTDVVLRAPLGGRGQGSEGYPTVFAVEPRCRDKERPERPRTSQLPVDVAVAGGDENTIEAKGEPLEPSMM